MKEFNTVNTTGLLGEDINCGHIKCTETCTLRLNNVIKENDSYIYQIVIKALDESKLTLKIGLQSFDLSITTSWQRLLQKFEVYDSTRNIDLVFSPGEYWFYNTKLEIGIIPTDWTPAPEDFDEKVYTIQSEFKQRTDQIEMSVSSKQDIPITSVRYIRDWLNGNNIDNINYWSECRIVNTESQNIVENETVTISGKDSSLNDFTITNIDKLIDGTLPSSDQYVEGEYATCTGKACVEIDLGIVHNDIDYIQIWHRFVTDDTNKMIFNHKLQVSSDGITWITLYDSDISGGYAETSDGRTYYMSETSVYKNINSLTMGLTESQSKIANLDGQVSTLNQNLDSISATMGANKEEADSKIESLKDYINEQGEQIKKDAMTDFRAEADGIYATASSVDEMGNELRSYVKQDSSSWRMLFAQLGMGEDEDKLKVDTNIELNINGITVTNPNTGQQTIMTIDQFAGLYNGEKVFWIDKDTTKTTRFLCKKGWDTDYIKMTTNAYLYPNGTVLRGVAYVKSGGNS